MRTWLPLTPSTVTVTSSPIINVSPTRLVRISISLSSLLPPTRGIGIQYAAERTRITPIDNTYHAHARNANASAPLLLGNDCLESTPTASPLALERRAWEAFTVRTVTRYSPSWHAARHKTLSDGLAAFHFCGTGLRVEAECRMQRADTQFQIFLVDHDGNLDLRGGDHLNVDPFIGQGTEHPCRDAGMRTHADTDQRDLADLRGAADFAGSQLLAHRLGDLEGALVIGGQDREGEIGQPFGADVLDNHVHFDIGVRHRPQDGAGD